jgi:hypothetical protein
VPKLGLKITDGSQQSAQWFRCHFFGQIHSLNGGYCLLLLRFVRYPRNLYPRWRIQSLPPKIRLEKNSSSQASSGGALRGMSL